MFIFDIFIKLQDKEDDLHSSVFHATLEYWYNLNRSTQFNAAVKALNKHITLPQVEIRSTTYVFSSVLQQ